MTEDQWQRVQEIFFEAVNLAPEARSAFLDQACAADLALRRQVESLLRHQKEDGSSFISPLTDQVSVSEEAPSLSPGDWIGPYEIVTLIGAGGMGEVYRAFEPRLRRNVAIKVLPSDVGWDPEHRRRFECEAQALAALSHPYIAAIYGLVEAGEVRAMAMELVEGATLAEGIARGPILTRDVVHIAKQITEALEYAREKGIVHRDLKPANIMVTRDGHVKLLDFGLAQRVPLAESETDTLTGVGKLAGTVGYMSPEQARGIPVDHRTDLFSFGVVLYEIVAGERPFKGDSAMAVIDAILNANPRNLDLAPRRLNAIILRLLEKDPAKRYQNAGEVRHDLSTLESSLHFERPLRRTRIAGWLAIVAALLLAGWLWREWSRERWARQTAVPEIARLVEAGEFVKAAALTQEARAVIPNDPTFEKLWIRSTGEVSIATAPADAEVSIRSYRGVPKAWIKLGKTPLTKVRVPLDDYLWRIGKPGFAPVFLIATPPHKPLPGYAHPPFSLSLKLRSEASVPPGMVVVPGGVSYLGTPFATVPAVRIAGFLIDQHEVTNEDYKRFVDAGGYQKRELWKQPFLKEGRSVPWADAIALFHDTTGRPGPATWEVGGYPKGKGKYPVAGLSWYEAAAYAEFVGKSLPTAYHWTLASQSQTFTPLITPRSNFGREGPRAIESDRGLSGFGTSDMAGNVKEWCWNEGPDGKRFILGGSFAEPEYMFHHADTQTPWARRSDYGFRCVKLDAPPTAAVTAVIQPTIRIRDYWNEKPVSKDVFNAYTALYAYDKGETNAKVESTVAGESWSRLKVTFDAAYGHERVTAHLYLPRNAAPPFQTVIYFPGVYAFLDDNLDLSTLEDNRAFLLQSGRAVIFPIYKGMYERRDGYQPGKNPPAFQRDHQVAWAKDMGRSLDYLATRKDIDMGKVAFFGDSAGANQGAILPAIEKRIQTAILSSGGLQLPIRYLPDGDPFNFVGRVTVPVLMLNGRYDGFFPLQSSQRPLFHFLGTTENNKRHVVYEGGHGVFPRPDAVRECLDWLDKYLGPVRH